MQGCIRLPKWGHVQSSTTREQVTKEYLQFSMNPVLADGTRYVGGQEGYVLPKHIVYFDHGQLVCADNIPHNPAPATPTASEMRTFKQQNPAWHERIPVVTGPVRQLIWSNRARSQRRLWRGLPN